jgi:glycosyltransferase involved in cell wall biosynthesis
MKILYHHRTASKDGQYVHIEEMIDALRGLGHEVIVVAPAAANKSQFGDDAGAVVWLKSHLPRFMYELMELAYSLMAYRQLARAVRAHQPDCLYERYNLFQPAGVWIKRRYRLPLLLEVNAPIFAERVRYDGISLQRLARWSEHYTWRNADLVLPVTRVLGDMVQSAGVAAERIVVIPNGINTQRFGAHPDTLAAKRALGLDGHLVLGFTGFVRDWHGMDKVIDFIAHDGAQAHCHLLVVGDGPARAALEQQAQRLGVAERVTFTGVVQRDAVAAYVAAFDIALQPAVVAYASPLKLFEYLAMGRAIVAPSQANIREILRDSENALLFDPQDESGLVQAIRRLMLDADLRQRLANNAAKTIAEQTLTWTGNAQRVTALAERLAQHRHGEHD